MKLIKFRIQNYKSIKDSGWCWLASDVTTLAGKNESGKSAILEAIKYFEFRSEPMPDSAKPLDGSGDPKIEMCFQVSDSMLGEVADETSITICADKLEYLSKNNIFITKYYDGEYDLDEETKQEVKEAIEISKSEDNEDEESDLNKEDHTDQFIKMLIRFLPKFILFDDFLDILPFEIPLSQAKENRPVRDFAKVSALDLDKVINTTDSQQRRNLLSAHSAKISGDFKGYWEQAELELVAEPDGGNLRLGVRESGNTLLFKTEQRSKGFQWFLSFYLRLNAEQGHGRNVILIDEPGLYLHAKAQQDVLKVFEKISEESQVIISTHSPYLIDSHRLDRVRLISKDEQNGTQIGNKIHKDAEAETLTPIITAIGLDLASEFSIAGKKNVLLEGISDYFYLQALRKSTNTNEVNFIPCVGAPRISQLVSLLIGWDLEFLVVLDNDSQGKRTAKELREKLLIQESRIIFISEKNNFSTEDLFTHDDFNNFVLQDEESKNLDSDTLNSKFLKDKKLDKVLLAKKFFEAMNNGESKIKLSEETLGVFRKVFRKIEEDFSTSDI